MQCGKELIGGGGGDGETSTIPPVLTWKPGASLCRPVFLSLFCRMAFEFGLWLLSPRFHFCRDAPWCRLPDFMMQVIWCTAVIRGKKISAGSAEKPVHDSLGGCNRQLGNVALVLCGLHLGHQSKIFCIKSTVALFSLAHIFSSLAHDHNYPVVVR